MVRDLNFEIEIFDLPTVRDADGLALSSRNSYLTPEQRPAALTLQQALHVAARIIAKGERSAAKIASNLREVIRAQPGAEIEYISICHPETLHELDTIEVRTLVALAVRVGRARLIDNTLFDLRELSLRADLKKPAKPVPSPQEGVGAKPSNKAAVKTAVKTSEKTAVKLVVKAAVKPMPPAAGKPAAKPAIKTPVKPATSPAAKSTAKAAASAVPKVNAAAGKKAARR
jgi:pantoate--beta-alanine ligase